MSVSLIKAVQRAQSEKQTGKSPTFIIRASSISYRAKSAYNATLFPSPNSWDKPYGSPGYEPWMRSSMSSAPSWVKAVANTTLRVCRFSCESGPGVNTTWDLGSLDDDAGQPGK